MRGAVVPRRAVPAFLALGLAVAGVLAAAPPCLACSCATSTPRGAFRSADAAFVGTVVRDSMVARGTTQTFAVEEVYKGALPSQVDVFAQIGTEVINSCAVLFPSGESVAVLLSVDGKGRWTASACSQIDRAQLRRVAGKPQEPRPLPSPEVAAPPRTLGDAEASSGLPAWVVVALGAITALALVGGQIVWAARRDRRARYPSGWDPVDVEEPQRDLR